MRLFLPLLCAIAISGLRAATPVPFALDFSGFGGPASISGRTIATGLNLGYGMAALSDGSLLIGQNTPQTSAGVEGGPTTGAVLLISKQPNGDFADPQQVIGGLTGPVTCIRRMSDGTILVDAGAGSSRTLAFYDSFYRLLGTLTFAYPAGLWWHSTGMSVVAPSSGGTQDVYFIIGSQSDAIAGPQIQTGGLISVSLKAASIYRMKVRPQLGSIQVISAPELVADGLRNAYGLAFDSEGNLLIADNGVDNTPNGTAADTLYRVAPGNVLIHFGFPASYTVFSTCTRIQGDPTAVLPVTAICLIPGDEAQGVAGMSFVSPGTLPFLGNLGGLFLGFHGAKNAAGPANDENALMLYDLQLNQYRPVVHAGTAGVGHLNTVLVSGTSLYILDMSSQGTVNGVDGLGSSRLYEFALPVPLPAVPVLASPASGATEVSASPLLTWLGVTGATSYDVYLGTSGSPPLVANTSTTSYSALGLTASTTYNWQIIAKNGFGSATSELR